MCLDMPYYAQTIQHHLSPWMLWELVPVIWHGFGTACATMLRYILINIGQREEKQLFLHVPSKIFRDFRVKTLSSQNFLGETPAASEEFWEFFLGRLGSPKEGFGLLFTSHDSPGPPSPLPGHRDDVLARGHLSALQPQLYPWSKSLTSKKRISNFLFHARFSITTNPTKK